MSPETSVRPPEYISTPHPSYYHPRLLELAEMSRFVSTLSSVHRGTAFERCSLNLLQDHFSMSLKRVGGKSDGGIDLIGWWWLPFSTTHFNNSSTDVVSDRPGPLTDPEGLPRRRLRVLAQCKAERKKFSPRYVREMEGVWHLQSKSRTLTSFASNSQSPLSLSSSSSGNENGNAYPTVALLLSESPFSQSTLLHAYRSNVPFLLIHIPSVSPTLSSESDPNAVPHVTESPELGSVFPNPALTQLVHPLSFRWERNPASTSCVTIGTTTINSTPEIPSWVRGRPGLWWDGRKLGSWVPDDEVISLESSEI